MKIARFITLFPYPESFDNPDLYNRYPVGGAHIETYNLARNLVSLGHKEVVFCASIDSVSRVEEFEGIRIIRCATNFGVQKGRFSFGLFIEPFKQDADLVHIHVTVPIAELAGYFYAKVKNKPFIVTFHGEPEGGYGTLLRRIGISFYRFSLPMILSGAKYIIVRSENYIGLTRFLTKYRKKIIVIPCGINPDEMDVPHTREDCRSTLGLPEDENTILFVGNLINYKSPNLLIEALPLIIEKQPATRLVFVGDGPLLPDLERLACRLNMSDKVWFAGHVSDEVKKMYYKAADIFVLPSTGVGESFGNVVLEAAAAGIPIVVSSLETFRAFIEDGHNGIIAKSGDIDSLAEAISRLISQPALRRKLSENAKQKVKSYSRQALAIKTAELYLQAIKGA